MNKPVDEFTLVMHHTRQARRYRVSIPAANFNWLTQRAATSRTSSKSVLQPMEYFCFSCVQTYVSNVFNDSIRSGAVLSDSSFSPATL